MVLEHKYWEIKNSVSSIQPSFLNLSKNNKLLVPDKENAAKKIYSIAAPGSELKNILF